MPSLDLMIAFFAAAAVFAYMPGPAMLYVSAQTIARGRRSGWMTALGIHIGGYGHVIAAGLGLAVVFSSFPTLYLALKIVSATYLCWLGARLIFSSSSNLNPANASTAHAASRSAFRNSITVELLNPKTALFYLAFLPQFTDPSAALPIWGQLLILGAIVNVLFSSADVICVVLADELTGWLKRSASANKWAQRLGGSLLIGLGIHLASQRH